LIEFDSAGEVGERLVKAAPPQAGQVEADAEPGGAGAHVELDGPGEVRQRLIKAAQHAIGQAAANAHPATKAGVISSAGDSSSRTSR
jgi:hypothetical protein